MRADGSALSPQGLDRLTRGLAGRARVVLRTGAAAHGFRHHYGVTLALRRVPGSLISQLKGHADPRTTSIYTAVAFTQLITALDDAGLLGPERGTKRHSRRGKSPAQALRSGAYNRPFLVSQLTH